MHKYLHQNGFFGLFLDIYAPTNCLCQKYWLIGIYGISKLPKFYRNDGIHDLNCCFGVAFKCPRKVHLNTQCSGGKQRGACPLLSPPTPSVLRPCTVMVGSRSFAEMNRKLMHNISFDSQQM